MTTMVAGRCKCGTAVERESFDGAGAIARFVNDLPFVCAECQIAQEREELEREAFEHAEHEQKRLRRRLEDAQIPALFAAVNLDDLDSGGNTNVLEAAREWGSGRSRGLLLTGPVGVGKSTIAAAALRSLLNRTPGRWLSAPVLMARLTAGFDSPERALVLAALTGRGAMVIDDLDKTRPTEYGAEQAFLAIDHCVSNKRPLLVTTNLRPGELAGKWPEPFGEAIASRLVGYCKTVAVTGRDRRLS